MSKKYTIRDIAKQAGVSVATVSYVINHRDDQRISEETKKKVWQIINLLDYRPNSSAKSLATSKTYNIALIMHQEASLYKCSEQLSVARTLASVLQSRGYHLLLQSEENVVQIDYADAILCYDTDTGFFNNVGDNNLIPLIAIDSLTPLQIFFQVCTDYETLKSKADERFGEGNYTYLCLAPNNAEIRELITHTFSSVAFVPSDDFCALSTDTSGNASVSVPLSGNVVYNQSVLAALAPENALCIPENLREKMERVFACFELASNRVPDCEHNIFV